MPTERRPDARLFPLRSDRGSVRMWARLIARKYIGQFSDTSNLSYLNARYYNQIAALEAGPVPSGRWFKEFITGTAIMAEPTNLLQHGRERANQVAQDNSCMELCFRHPYTTGALVAVGSYPAFSVRRLAVAAFQMATYPGVGATFCRATFRWTSLSALAIDSTLAIRGLVVSLAKLTQVGRHLRIRRCGR